MSFERLEGEDDEPITPAMLAYNAAVRVFMQAKPEVVTIEDKEILSGLSHSASELDLADRPYFCEVSRGLSIPVQRLYDSATSVISFTKLTFEGIFREYSKVSLERLTDGTQPVKALCLAFDEVTLLPYFESLPNDHLLHVPVLAVDSIDQT